MEIKRTIDERTKEVWTFSMIHNVLYLNTYTLLRRESKSKRKYKAIKNYDRLMYRNSTIEECEVPFNDTVKRFALEKYFSTVKCLRWSER